MQGMARGDEAEVGAQAGIVSGRDHELEVTHAPVRFLRRRHHPRRHVEADDVLGVRRQSRRRMTRARPEIKAGVGGVGPRQRQQFG